MKLLGHMIERRRAVEREQRMTRALAAILEAAERTARGQGDRAVRSPCAVLCGPRGDR
jgi:hypothetical protein